MMAGGGFASHSSWNSPRGSRPIEPNSRSGCPWQWRICATCTHGAVLAFSVMSEVTRLLQQMRQGHAGAGAALLPLVYDELRRLARARMAQERVGHTLEA